MLKNISAGLIIILLCIALYILFINSFSKTNKCKVFEPFNKYYLQEPYFAKDIYIVPGQAKLAHNKDTANDSYTSDYLPYESAIPAIDVLRANKQYPLHSGRCYRLC
jgi:hypothetical protein